MELVDLNRTVLSFSFLAGSVLWVLAIHKCHQIRASRDARLVRVLDVVWPFFAFWGAVVFEWAVVTDAPAVFVRDWITYVLPPVVVYPPYRLYYGARKITDDLRDIGDGAYRDHGR